MSDPRPKNRLLAALPDGDFGRLLPDLRTIPITLKQPLHHVDQPMEHVYFLNGGMASITALLSNGRMVEAATVGNEGMVGIEAVLLDSPVSPGESMIQVPNGSAEMLSVRAFRVELARHGALANIMGRYAQTVIAQMMHVAACNALHSVEERSCRWLLMTHDRVGQDQFMLTHEFLSIMLAVHRPSVSGVAASLQAAGLIRYSRGLIQILDRKGLERASCECYVALRQRLNALWSGDGLLPEANRTE